LIHWFFDAPAIFLTEQHWKDKAVVEALHLPITSPYSCREIRGPRTTSSDRIKLPKCDTQLKLFYCWNQNTSQCLICTSANACLNCSCTTGVSD
jgi:hypothetical protein